MRIFKTKWFNKEANCHAIRDNELREAAKAAIEGKADNLGGGVYKKRLNQNRDRAIILAKGGKHWCYVYLYAKQDISSINYRELAGFRELAKYYACLADDKITALIHKEELVEIPYDGEE